jgi:hypothetical protein
MLGLAAPRLLCLRQTRSTLKGTATAHRTRYMRDPCSLKDVQRCEKKRKEMRRNAKKCKEMQRNAKERKETRRNMKKRDENAKCRKVMLR